jgi:hypothetical protein
MNKKFRITYEFAGVVSAYIVSASSKYSAKQKFYVEYPRAEILKVEVEDEQD